MKSKSVIVLIFLVYIILSKNASAQTGWWGSSDTVNIYNKNQGSVMVGSSAPLGKLTVGPYHQFYNMALIGDYSNLGKNYLQIGVAGMMHEKIQGQTLFDLTHSNMQPRYTGFNFRANNKSLFFINGEGNVGVGTEKPEARLDMYGGPAWGPYYKSLRIQTNHAIQFESGAYQFGIVPQNNELSFFVSNNNTGVFESSFNKLLTLRHGRMVVEGDLEVRGQVITQGQVLNGNGNNGNGGNQGGPVIYAAAPGEAASGSDGWLGGNTSGSIYYSQGPVGIGTSTPALISGVSGSFIDIAHNNNPGLALSNKSGGRQFFLYSANNGGIGSFRIYDATGSADRFVIHQNGNIGVGTANPNSKLEVAGSNGNPLISANVLSGYGAIGLQSNGTNKMLLGYNGSAGNYGTQTIAGDVSIQSFSNLHFVVDTDPTTHPSRLFIGTSGNVGIGTVTPGYKLDVAGTINAQQLMINGSPVSTGSAAWTTSGSNINYSLGNVGIGASATAPTAKLNVRGDGSINLFSLGGTSTDNIGYFSFWSNGSPNRRLLIGGMDGIMLGTGDYTSFSEKMRMDVNGNIGIGTTAPENKLHISRGSSGGSIVKLEGATGDAYYMGYDGTGGYLQMGNAKSFSIYPSATANGNITLAASGNVGIGTTSPSQKLSVSGVIESISGGFRFPDGTVQITAAPSSSSNWSMYSASIAHCSTAVIIGAANPTMVSKISSDNHQLVVNGSMTTKKVVVTQQGWADFVFESDYRLRPLSEVEQHIKDFKHLPEIPSAKEIENSGIDLGEVQARLLQKIEELTLYMIEQNKKIENLQNEINVLKQK